MADNATDLNAVELATELTVGWLGNPNTRIGADEVPAFLGRMHAAVTSLLGTGQAEQAGEMPAEHVPAVSVRRSLASKDHIVSLIDGKPYKTLRRRLATNGLTPDQYRERYNLRADYPMVSENYSESRRALGKRIGLGRKPGQRAAAVPAKAAEKASAPRRRGRSVQVAADGN